MAELRQIHSCVTVQTAARFCRICLQDTQKHGMIQFKKAKESAWLKTFRLVLSWQSVEKTAK